MFEWKKMISCARLLLKRWFLLECFLCFFGWGHFYGPAIVLFKKNCYWYTDTLSKIQNELVGGMCLNVIIMKTGIIENRLLWGQTDLGSNYFLYIPQSAPVFNTQLLIDAYRKIKWMYITVKSWKNIKIHSMNVFYRSANYNMDTF